MESELQYRESSYFNEGDNYVFENSCKQIFVGKAYKENGFWYFAKAGVKSSGDYKCTSVKSKAL